MPIIHFINSKTQTAGGMKNVLAYVTRTEKTKSEDKQHVTALNCSAPTAYAEMLATKNAYHKNSGRMYYHLVQSFPKGNDTSPELAHRIAVELAEKAFGNYECVVATHIDREHIHSHFVFNSVSFEDGRKYHSNGNTVQELMDLSDEICMRYGVTVLDKQPQKKKDVLSDREYRSAVRGESWKFQLMNTVTEVMKQEKLNTNEILIDEVAADIVREIFQKYLEGYGISAIAKQLNARGIKSPEYFSHRRISSTRTKLCKKYLWVQTSVKRILENEIYTGTLVNHKTITSKIYKTKSFVPAEEQIRHENFLPAIIDKQTYEQAQKLLENHKQGNIRAGENRTIHRYCSMIKCAECGAILIAKHRVCKNNEWVEYTCNSHHRYGKEYCTPHRIHESQLDEIVYDEVRLLLIRIQEQSKKYDKIVRDWQRQKPAYERKIEQYKERIASLRQQIEDLIIERISDREHASVFNNMITKREEEIADLQKKIEESKQYDEVSKRKRNELKTTADLLEKMIEEQHISDANLRLLVKTVYVHQNEDKSLDVRLEFNGDFEDSVAVYVEGESA